MYKWLFVSISCLWMMTNVHSVNEVLNRFTDLFGNVRSARQLTPRDVKQAEELIMNAGDILMILLPSSSQVLLTR